MHILKKLLRFLLITYFLMGILSAALSIHEISSILLSPGISIIIFLSGFLFFIFLWILFFRTRGTFWSTLEHELTHAVFALICFKKINSINANRFKGGWIKIDSGNSLIALSPYIFSPTTILLVILLPLFKSEFALTIIFLIGYSLAFHYAGLLREAHLNQPDIYETGIYYSVFFILFFNLLLLFALIFWIDPQTAMLPKINKIFFLNIVNYLKQLIIFLVSYL